MGIGENIAYELAKQGYDLVLVARSQDRLEAVKKQLLHASPQREVMVLPLDLLIKDAAIELYKKAISLPGRIELVVNNAGFGDFGPFVDSDWKKCEQMLTLNMSVLAQTCHLFGQYFKNQKMGYLLNVASTAAFQAGPGMSAYYATKAFVLHFSEGLYEELKPFGVVVTALCPGPTLTGFQKSAGMEKSALLKVAFMTSSSLVATQGVQGCLAGKAIVIPGKMNQIATLLAQLSPRFMVRKVVARIQRSE